MTTDLVYHVSEQQGIQVFEPRPFWHNANMTASGTVPAGVLPADDPLGPQAHAALRRLAEQHGVHLADAVRISLGVFASDRPWPVCYAPPEIKKLGVWTRPSELAYLEITASYPSSGELTYLFEQKEEAKIRQYKFSVYGLEARNFRRIPSGEFLAEKSVRPVHETKHDDALRAILDSGISVVFVADMERCYEILKHHNACFDVRWHIVGAIRDTMDMCRERLSEGGAYV
jgi:hypothetical protein